MIDYLLVVLLFALVPIGIILMFIGCFYCFLFIEHCATYSDDSEEHSNGSHNTRREEGTPTPSTLSVTNEPRVFWERRENIFPREDRVGKRLGVPVLTHASSDLVIGSAEQLPPPSYHSICFNKDDRKQNFTVQKVTFV